MSLPPTVIAIKRKRGDEPLDVLGTCVYPTGAQNY